MQRIREHWRILTEESVSASMLRSVPAHDRLVRAL